MAVFSRQSSVGSFQSAVDFVRLLIYTCVVEAGDLCDAAFDCIPDLDEDGAVKGKEYINPAAEFYKSKFFAAAE